MTFGYLKRAEFTKALGELLHNRVYHCSTEDIFGPTVYHNYICAGGGGGRGIMRTLYVNAGQFDNSALFLFS